MAAGFHWSLRTVPPHNIAISAHGRTAVDDLNLVEQYFQRELTEDEKLALDELMERSPEAARLFVEKSKAVYQPQALPELKLPPQPLPLGGLFRLSKWWWVLAGYGLLAAAFWFWSRNHDFYWPWESREPVALSGPAAPPVPNTPKTSSLTAALLANAAGADTDPAAISTPEDEGNDAAGPIPVTALSPSSLEHPGPRVLVNRSVPGRVTVTVLDATGKEIQFLYSGVVQTGQWVFEWNGRRADGSRAPIGNYTLQVRSGLNIQKQEIWISQ